MTWTDERKAVAAKLYREGWSCSQIAKQLGGGISRNAVIGAIYRMGMSGEGRAAPARPARMTRPKPTSPKTYSTGPPLFRRRRSQ